jgi:hypothetical protein
LKLKNNHNSIQLKGDPSQFFNLPVINNTDVAALQTSEVVTALALWRVGS